MSTEPNLPPALYRSEAFAEDLDPEVPAPAVQPALRLLRLQTVLRASLLRASLLTKPAGAPRPA